MNPQQGSGTGVLEPAYSRHLQQCSLLLQWPDGSTIHHLQLRRGPSLLHDISTTRQFDLERRASAMEIEVYRG